MLLRRLRAVVFAGGLAFFALAQMAVPAAAGDCAASASAAWKPAGGKTYRSEAFSNGPICALAMATLVVRAPDGKVVWSDALATEHLMTFNEVKTRAQMAGALREWLIQSHTFNSTADLPPWNAGSAAPTSSNEFPFYADAALGREAYEKMRAEKLPVFCYVQGMESMTCLGLSMEGEMTKIGVQTFPG
jgi:hypothetical protein